MNLENVYIDKRKQVKLTGFSFAKANGAKCLTFEKNFEKRAFFNLIFGAAEYTAPEILDGNTEFAVNQSSDVWSLYVLIVFLKEK